ncbi:MULTISPECIES: carbamoyltransferase family protein [Saliphagus]|uniref:Carbamoyltransferase n=1 Tax=Saliphagus infecundisoli TaxID=1849069 RepID=A0ABD5QL87_9EURY|nr:MULTISPECIES: carbamoyltransferase C-terminal domain-containing protein [Saliphagus]
MSEYLLSFKPAIGLYGQHDPAAALFEDGELVYGIEEERLTREKHAPDTFPTRAIRTCLDYRDLDLADVDRIVLPYDPTLRRKILTHYLRDAATIPGLLPKLTGLENVTVTQLRSRFLPTREIESKLADIGGPVPEIETRSHHECHAASAFHPSGFSEAAVLTIDAKGEYDSTVVWHGTDRGLKRLRTYDHPNSLGIFFAIVTEFLGYRMFNGEGKVMGLAPYGERNPEIERTLRELVEFGVDYDVTPLTKRWGTDYGVSRLEEAFGREQVDRGSEREFDRWEKDFAHTAQKLLEETVLEIAVQALDAVGTDRLALAGGVALNCKLNKRLRESPAVSELFVQPVAHDAGLPLGAGWLESRPADVPEMTDAYLGPAYDTREIDALLETNKIAYDRPEDLEEYVASRLADGALVGWFQGRLEMGPRALGARSILADPRTVESRDRVNRYVKHREEWRPFAPSMTEAAAEEYLVDGGPAPFMINGYDANPDRGEDLEAVLHPGDDTTRPQTVREDQHPRYHRLISAFGDLTGVPVVLNTSFNDHGEPIVNTPTEAIKDFYGMGLDVLAIEDVVVEKHALEA